jgi:hypothetical protein
VAAFSDLVEVLHSVGGALGAGGGLFAGRLYAKLTEAVKNAKSAHETVAVLSVKVAELTSDATNRDTIVATKEWVLHEIDRLLRSSKPAIGGDELIKHRLNELERRMSAIEDQRDSDLERSREWNEETRGILGEILGQLKMSNRRS